MMIVITGGSGSGKSEYAEWLMTELEEGRRIYIATMQPFDAECAKRIERHRAMRAEKRFETVECYAGLKKLTFEGRPSVLLECMSNLTANEMYREDGAGDRTAEEILLGVMRLKDQTNHLIIVTNEVFSDGVVYDEETAVYQKTLGKINQELAGMADCAAESVYSVPVYFKGEEPCFHHL